MDYLKLIDCEIGDWGVLVTALGDLIMIRPRFIGRTLANRNNSGLIRTREDTAGFCDGDLIIQDMTFIGDATTGAVQLFEHQQNTGNPKPAGSPIDYRFWRNIKIDGISFPTAAPSAFTIRPAEIELVAGGADIDVCKSLTMKNVKGPVRLQGILDGHTATNEGRYGIELDIEDCKLDEISWTSQDDNFKTLAQLRNVRPWTNGVMAFEVTADSDWTILGGQISKLDFFSGAEVPAGSMVNIKASGTNFIDDGTTSFVVGINDNVEMVATDCVFDLTASNRFFQLLPLRLIRPQLFVAGAPTSYQVAGNPDAPTKTYSLAGPPRDGQRLRLLMNFTGDLVEYEFNLPPVGYRAIIPGYHPTTGETLGILHRTGPSTLVHDGAITFRDIKLAT